MRNTGHICLGKNWDAIFGVIKRNIYYIPNTYIPNKGLEHKIVTSEREREENFGL